MRLTVLNGSPRGKTSNSRALLDHFLEGLLETDGNTCEVLYLNRVNSQDEFVQAYTEAEAVLMAFPLYTDAMPAMVKTFIESLAPLRGQPGNPPMGFIIHSGFNEPAHSRYLERYLEKLTRRLGSRYLGTIVRGGSEGIQLMPPMMTRKLFRTMRELGQVFGQTGTLDQSLVRSLAKHERFSWRGRLLLNVMVRLGITDSYWNGQLKKNVAFERRFARPYADPGFSDGQ
jgi:multimeric flavodoxin WrbA